MMKYGLLIFLAAWGSICTSYGQQENIWAFGTGSGVDFNGGPPVAVATAFDGYGEASASVCNGQGQLQFYTNGYKVWDRNGNLMPGGNGIINDPLLGPIPPNALDYTSSASQGALIVPVPGQASKYYLFSMTSFEIGVANNGMGRLYYSIVDMQLNGGLGDIVSGQKCILVDSGLTEHMTAVTGDRCNVWLLATSRQLNTLRAYEISESGINTTPVSSPLLTINGYVPIGSIAASADRKTLAVARSGVGLYRFDAATGIATGTIPLAPPYTPSSMAYSVCFSPNDSKLYVSFGPLIVGLFYAFQYDLSSGDSLTMINSRVELPEPASCSFKKGPDGKVYSTSRGTALNVIRHPDLPMPACEYVADALPLTGMVSFGLPNIVATITRDTMGQRKKVQAGCFTTGITLRATEDTTAWGFLWGNGAAGPQLVAEEPGDYSVTYYTAPCVRHTDTFSVSFPDGKLPSLSIQASCKGEHNGKAYVRTYPGDTVQYSYAWRGADTTVLSVADSLTGIASGSYTLRIRTAHCDTTLSFYIPEESYQVSFDADTIICQSAPLIFSNTSDGYFTSFQWRFGDQTESMDAAPVHSYTRAGSYTVMLAGKGALCSDTAIRQITVDSMTMARFDMDKDSICTGEWLHFYPEASAHTVLSYQWQWGDGTSRSMLPDSMMQHAYDMAGRFYVMLTVHYRACPDQLDSASVLVHALPKIYLGPDTLLCLDGRPITLANQAGNGTDRLEYTWNTGEHTETISVRHPGRYSLQLINAHGCSSTEAVEVNKDCYIDIPNAFTPNNDGVNDYFFPRQLLSAKLSRFRMQVFNRWGQCIFETNRVDGRGWDGRFNGKEQPGGVYIYQIEAEIDGRHQERYEGNVTLLR